MDPNTTTLPSIPINISFPMTYILKNEQADGPVLVLLHGYSDTGAGIWNRIFVNSEYPGCLFAPNAPFPVPQKTENDWKELYAWYFRSLQPPRDIINPESSVSAMVQIMTQLKLMDREKWIIGYSQGGYFAPHLFRHIPRITRFLGMGAAYRIHDYPKNPSVMVDAMHGEVDQVVSCEKSILGFQELKKMGYSGHFEVIPSMGHNLNDHGRKYIDKWLKNNY